MTQRVRELEGRGTDPAPVISLQRRLTSAQEEVEKSQKIISELRQIEAQDSAKLRDALRSRDDQVAELRDKADQSHKEKSELQVGPCLPTLSPFLPHNPPPPPPPPTFQCASCCVTSDVVQTLWPRND